MQEKRQGIVWVLSLGLIFVIGMAAGCSDDAAAPSAGSSSSGGAAPSAPSTPSTSPTAPAPPTPPETPSPAPIVEEPVALSTEELVEGGRSTYNANCIACHSLDPSKDGVLGPAIAGASLELLEARVLLSEYPEGYQPKRTTRVMIALPHLEPRLAELTAYLSSLE